MEARMVDAWTRLAPHFAASEFAVSSSNPDLVTHPRDWTEAEAHNVARVAAWLDQARAVVGGPLVVTSGLRRSELNAAIGGSARSWHLDGRAADFRPPPGMTSLDVLGALWDADCFADDIIAYHPERGGHLHVQIDGALTPRRRYRVRMADGRYVGMYARHEIDALESSWR